MGAASAGTSGGRTSGPGACSRDASAGETFGEEASEDGTGGTQARHAGDPQPHRAATAAAPATTASGPEGRELPGLSIRMEPSRGEGLQDSESITKIYGKINFCGHFSDESGCGSETPSEAARASAAPTVRRSGRNDFAGRASYRSCRKGPVSRSRLVTRFRPSSLAPRPGSRGNAAGPRGGRLHRLARGPSRAAAH